MNAPDASRGAIIRQDGLSASASTDLDAVRDLVNLLTCLSCGAPVSVQVIAAASGYPELGVDGWLQCTSCAERYPIIGGSPRMLDNEGRARLAEDYPEAAIDLRVAGYSVSQHSDSVRRRTAEGFAYEWQHFGRSRSEWRKNFLDYLQPHSPDTLRGKVILDVGTGSGRHSGQAAALGARVVAIDVGRSIDVARANLPRDVLTVQADAERLPFTPGAFDLVLSIGVLHHLANTQRALDGLVRFVKPGGNLHVYLYWVPEIAWHRAALKAVTAARRATVKLPFGVLRWLCYPLSAALWFSIVLPYRALRRRPRTYRIAQMLPLQTYADYPFEVLVNDQFDRFSAPIEHRFTRAQVHQMLEAAGLEQVVVIPNYGWVGDGRQSVAPSAS